MNELNTDDLENSSSKQEKREARHLEQELVVKKRKRDRLYKRAILWLVVLLVIIGSIWGIIKIAKAPRVNTAVVIQTVSPQDWVMGSTTAKVILTEYSDFQCPACGAYYPLLKQLTGEYKDKIAFVYRHFPLSRHANAKPAAYAAEAAGRQGKFWEMHDMLFENQDKWSDDKNASGIFESYADKLGLNMDQFKKDRDSQATKDRVESDYNSVATVIDHTPTFFINGKMISNPTSYDEFKKDLDEAITQNP